MFKKIAIATATAALFSIGQSATAGQTSNTLNVTANVAANCLVTTAPVDYSGSYDPVSTNAVANLDFDGLSERILHGGDSGYPIGDPRSSSPSFWRCACRTA